MQKRKEQYSPENSRFAVFFLLLMTLSLPFLVGYHFSVINPITPALQRMYNQTYEQRFNEAIPEQVWTSLLTLSASTIIVGAFVAGVSTTSLLNHLTGKQITLIANVVNIGAIAIMSLGSGLTGSYEAFIIGRFLAGIPCGVSYGLVPIVIAETSTRSSQAFWQSMFGVSISFGLLSGSILANPNVLGTDSLWPVSIGLGVIPSITFLLVSFKLPETPYYLIRAGRMEEAEASLKKLRNGDKASLDFELEEIEKEISEGLQTEFGIGYIIRRKQYRNQLIAVMVLFGYLMLCGVNNIVLYSSLVFTDAGLSEDNASLATIGVFGLQFIMACVGSKIVDRFGGKRVCVGASVIIIIALSIFTISQATVDMAPDVMPFISIASVGFFMMAWSGGTNLGTFALLGELTIEPTRATCFRYGNVVLWVSSWIVGFVPPYLQIALGAYSMVIWIACSIVAFIYMIVCIPNTRGKTPEQIQRKLGARLSTSSVRSTTPLGLE